MAEQLENLLKKIQDEAVTKADETAKQKLSDAEKKSAEIIAAAEKKAESIVIEAEQKAEQFAENGKKSLEQAARDVLIYLRKSIDKQFEELIRKSVPEIIPVEVVQEILIKLATEARTKGTSAEGIRIFLSPNEYKSLTDFFMKRFHEEVKKGAEFHPMPGIKAGFRICLRDKDVEYDYSDDVIVQMLSNLISPVLDEILKKAVEEK
ncbi:MAG: hypothetical protein DRI44_04795 [Chlamydiae bacterium]|nr:MAG: hypothetical protein DRI44_04795 [Chlamydiota bacterium]